MNPTTYVMTLAASTLLWNLIHVASSHAIRRALDSPRGQRFIQSDARSQNILREQGASYVVSTLHALFVVTRGAFHLSVLFRASIPLKLHDPFVFPFSTTGFTPYAYQLKHLAEITRVVHTNTIFGAYLLCDLFHVIAQYPKLGAIDTVLHHLSFLYCSAIAGYFHLHPFMFAWLILGEASTPFLNFRWFLIKAGYGHTKLLTFVQLCFALIFFVTRIALYTAGLCYQIEILPRMPHYIPSWAAYSTFSFVIVGFFLNIAWFFKIVRMVIRPRPKPSNLKRRNSNQSSTSNPPRVKTN